MGGRLKDGKIEFDISKRGGAYVQYTFTDACVHTEGRQVSRWHVDDDCNLLGRFQS